MIPQSNPTAQRRSGDAQNTNNVAPNSVATTTDTALTASTQSGSSSNNANKKLEYIGVYKIGPEIGKGSFATVYKCIDTTNNKAVAIKSVYRSKLKSKKLLENLEIEIQILKSMKHPHIVGLLDYKQTTSYFHLVMDYCSMGDLSYFIRRRNNLVKSHPVISSLLHRYPSPEGSHGLNEVLVLHFLRQLSSALQFLRDKSLVHRDIKPQNLLLCPPVHSKQEFIDGEFVGMWELPILKIADFGFARFLPSTSMAETLCGSPLYMAPEILRYEKYNAKADLWSVGAVLYEMTVGKPPFKAGNHIELLKNIEKANDKIKFPSAAQVPEPLKQLIRSLLKYNPTERISFNEFFNDSLITCDLDDNDQPLETSQMDENLFISEYISPIAPAERSQFFKEQKKNDSVVRSPSPTTATTATPRQDNVVQQMTKITSPVPDDFALSIARNSSEFNLKKDDMNLEKDYVVVEKRAVEVNALADELAHAGAGADAIPNSRKNLDVDQTNRLASLQQQTETALYRRSSLSGSQKRPSFSERRISLSLSPTNALTKAIGLASNRLFGLTTNSLHSNVSAIAEDDDSSTSNNDTSSFSTVIPSTNNHVLLQKLNLATIGEPGTEFDLGSVSNLDEQILDKLELIANIANAVNLYADVKFSQIIPSPPSSDGIEDDTEMLPPKIIHMISQEGIGLYIKTLSLLGRAMDIAGQWWFEKYDVVHGERPSFETTVRINQIVQWIREKYNISLERLEFLKSKSDFTAEETIEDNEPNGTTRVQQAIFAAALGIARETALKELLRNSTDIECSYVTSIYMLLAILEDLEESDRQEVKKIIEKINSRLKNFMGK